VVEKIRGWFIKATLGCRLLSAKLADEERALDLCRTKARQKKLPMEVIDAEFQWQVVNLEDLSSRYLRNERRDRRKLTFYFIADKRIDFRELVRELFRYVSRLF
jgi:cell fate regulator YaaT (PSP1 superfamily)